MTAPPQAGWPRQAGRLAATKAGDRWLENQDVTFDARPAQHG